jgi:V/A-type H+-transporting ATPase subunit F
VKNLEIAVVGDKDTIMGLKLAGVTKTFETNDKNEAQQRIRELFQEPEVGIIITTELLADQIRSYLNKLTEASPIPIIIEIPSRLGERKGEDPILTLIKRAVGIEIKV